MDRMCVCGMNCDVTVPKHAAHISTRQFKSKFGGSSGNTLTTTTTTAHDFTVNYTQSYNIYKRRYGKRQADRQTDRDRQRDSHAPRQIGQFLFSHNILNCYSCFCCYCCCSFYAVFRMVFIERFLFFLEVSAHLAQPCSGGERMDRGREREREKVR